MNWLECEGKTTKQLRNSEMHMEMANIEAEGEGEGEKDVTRTPSSLHTNKELRCKERGGCESCKKNHFVPFDN